MNIKIDLQKYIDEYESTLNLLNSSELINS